MALYAVICGIETERKPEQTADRTFHLDLPSH
jgi:hypothetical protein